MLRFHLIAAAALASVMVPSVASAAGREGTYVERTRKLVDLRNSINMSRMDIRAKLQAGKGNPEFLRNRLALLNEKFMTLQQRIETRREHGASA